MWRYKTPNAFHNRISCYSAGYAEPDNHWLCLLNHYTMTTIFISHSAEDKGIARKLSSHLGEAGAKVWLDEEQIMLGDSIAGEISKAINALFLISGEKSKNRWLSSEVATALGRVLN